MSELNPNHGVTQEVREQWHKLCAIAIFKMGVTELKITSDDIDRFMESGRANIAVKPSGHTLTLLLVSDSEAIRLAREEGGLPV